MAEQKQVNRVPDYKAVELKTEDYVEEVETYEDSKGNKKSRTIVTWLGTDDKFYSASGKILTIAGRTVLRVTEWREV